MHCRNVYEIVPVSVVRECTGWWIRVEPYNITCVTKSSSLHPPAIPSLSCSPRIAKDNPTAQSAWDITLVLHDLVLCSLLMEVIEKSSMCGATGGLRRSPACMLSCTMQSIILQHEMPLLPLRKKTRDNGTVMEPSRLPERDCGLSISCTAHISVMDKQRQLTHGRKPGRYYWSQYWNTCSSFH